MGLLIKVKCTRCGFKSIPIHNDHCRRCNKQIPELVQGNKPMAKELFHAGTANKESTLTKLLRKRREVLKREESLRLKKQQQAKDREDEDAVATVEDGEQEPFEPPHFKSYLPDKFPLVKLKNTAVTRSVTAKEPVPGDYNIYEQSVGLWRNRDEDLEDIICGKILGYFTLVPCRTVRIGSYKVKPEGKVILSSVGVWICLPSIWNPEYKITLTIDMYEIKRVLANYSKPPTMFIYVVPSAVKRIQKLLDMDPNEGPYFDPLSPDETQRRITLLFMPLHADMIKHIKDIFGREKVLQELTLDESNDLLVRSSPPYAPFHSNMISVFV